MSGAGIQLRKEAYALLPWSAAVAFATVALAFLARGQSGVLNFRGDEIAWLAMTHVAGVLAVAALSIGHEFAHGTLGSLLVQPVDRRRLLWTKLLVTAAIVIGLAALAEMTYPATGPLRPSARPLVIWGPAAAGIGLVPVLTLLTRRPLGGVVFAIVVPGLILLVSDVFYPLAGGPQALRITWYGTLAASALGLFALLHLFPRLEIAGGSRARAEVWSAAGAAGGSAARVVRRHWALAQLTKEIRLQQMTLAVSGLYVLASIGILVAQQDPLYVGPTFGAVSLMHGGFIAVIAGSVASAEERHLGTLTSQTLQPIAQWRQWLVKAGATLGLSVLLAYGLPLAIMLLHQPADPFVQDLEGEYVVGVLLAGIAALYVSSLSSNSLWALLACLPALGGSLLVGAGLDPLMRAARRRSYLRTIELITPAMRDSVQDPGWTTLRESLGLVRAAEWYGLITLTVGLAFLVLYLAGRNHRSLDRGAGTVFRQVAVLVGYLVAGAFLYATCSSIVWMARS